jgi:hypothetical protein
MRLKPTDYEADLDAFRQKYPNVWIDAVSPEDVAGYADTNSIELPDDWSDPIYREIKEHISSNFDSEFGLTIADIIESIEYAKAQQLS